MELRRLGNTGLTVSRLGLGLAALGRPGYINLGHQTDLAQQYEISAMEARTHAVLDAAWAAGIRYVDVARSYGRAEVFLASWLAQQPPQRSGLTVGSKWGYTYTANWQVSAQQHEVKEHSLATLQRQWQESHTLLAPFLHLYQVHSATIESGILENRPVLRELSRLKDAGLGIGVSLSGAQQAEMIERTLNCQVDGVRLFDCIQATWNLLEPSAGIMLAEAHRAGIGVIVKEALANGRLTERNTAPSFAHKRHRLQAEARRLGTTLDAVSIAAVLAQPWADVVLSGAATEAQLQSNLAALTIHWDSEAANQVAGLHESPGDYWQQRSQLPWN